MVPARDPAFDVAGLPNPFSVYFPVFITNLYTAAIYVTALLISPPAGWTDTEQNVTSISVGSNARTEKSNATRAVPATPLNESVTVRYNYRTGSYAGPIIGFDDFTHAIYWENITAGTIEDTDSFEDPPVDQVYDDWALTNLVGTFTLSRRTTYVVHGAYALRMTPATSGCEGYISKSHTFGAGNRAYLFGFLHFYYAGSQRVTVSSPVEDLEIVYEAERVWRRFGVRCTPGISNTVRIYDRNYWGDSGAYITLDYLRWVRY